MITFGKIKVPILEDDDGNATWSVMDNDNHIMEVFSHEGDKVRRVFTLRGKEGVMFNLDNSYLIESHDHMIKLLQAMSVAHQYYTEHYGKE